MSEHIQSALIKGVLLAGTALAVVGCGGGGGGGESTGGLPGGPTPSNPYSIALSADATQLPLNTLGLPAGIGVNAPYTTTLYVTASRGGTNDPIPNTDGAFACNVSGGLNVGALYYLDGDEEHQDDDGNALAYRAISLDSSAGGASFHFHAGATAGTAMVNCSVTDPQSGKAVSATRAITVGQATGQPAQVVVFSAGSQVPGTPAFVFAQNLNGPTAVSLSARIADDANQPVANPPAGADNLFATIVPTNGLADDQALLSARGVFGKTVTARSINGFAQFSLISGASTGSVLVRVTADRADNNVSNGVTDPVSNLIAVQVVDTVPTDPSDPTGPSADPLAIASQEALPAATLRQPYATVLVASGGSAPYRWSLDPRTVLPGGLSLSPDGVLSGVPSAAGPFRFALRVLDDDGTSVVKDFSLNVQAAANALGVSSSSLPAGAVGVFYAAGLSAAGGALPYTWTSTQLPAGLALDRQSGLITGTPTRSGAYTLNVTVTDGNGVQANRNLGLQVDGAPGSGAVEDTTAPQVLFTIPTDGSTDVDRCSSIVVRFDEAIDPVTVTNVSLFVRRQGGQTFSMGGVSQLDDATFSLNQAAGCYDPSATYELVMTNSIRDVSGNQLARRVVEFSTGGTVDTVAPQVLYTIPQRDASGVDRCSDIVVRFNEAIDPVTVTNVSMFVRRQGGATFSMAGTTQVDDRSFVLNQARTNTGCYDPSTAYELVLTNSIRDVAQNSLVPEVVPFSTGGTLDTTPPQVAYTIPAAGAVDVSPTANVTVVFNEAMDVNSIVPESFAVYRIDDFGGDPIQTVTLPGSTTSVTAPSTLATATELIAETDRSFTFGPIEYNSVVGSLGVNLLPGQYYRVVMSTSPRDLVGNQIGAASAQPASQPNAPVALVFEFRVGQP